MSRHNKHDISCLKEYRCQNNLVQKDVAAVLDICREHYSRVERGKVYPGGNLLKRIEELIGKKIAPRRESKPASLSVMLKLFRKLKAEDKAAIILKMIRIIKGYNKIQPLVFILIPQLLFNLDFCDSFFLS